MLGRIADDRRLFDDLVLRDVPNTSSSVPQARAFFESRGFAVDARELYEAPTRLFNDPAADRELPKKKSLKRHYNHFKRAGALEFRNCRDAEEVAGYLDAFFEQHIGRRAATDAPSLFVDERARAFFRELAVRGASEGWLLFSVVLFDGKPIAMHFGFEYDGCITWYKPAFDMALARHSPGEVLIKYLFEYALERKVRELDFTIGEEPFKYRFANHTRANWVLSVYGSRASYYAGQALVRLREVVQRFPALKRAALKLLGPLRNQPWV
jgi:CelD/BcsL family acetyltransferase involved in cellulose biosynthesis